jgi:dGTPase
LLDEVRILKQLTRDYILGSPSLAAQQKGQEKILIDLFEVFVNDIAKPKYLPKRFLHFAVQDSVSHARVAADCLASLTETEAIALHARLHGYSSGSVLDPIVR